MNFYDDKANVDQYMNMSQGYDGHYLIDKLSNHLQAQASILELGIGPGKDLDILKEHYSVTGSDYSQVFIDLYRARNAEQRLLKLDAITIKTTELFDCIYSNKVLQHISEIELQESICQQANRLNNKGLIFHSFWYGEGSESFEGLRFVYYTENKLENLYSDLFEIIEITRYTEEEKDDSIYIVAKKK